jgi:hypothetical protein
VSCTRHRRPHPLAGQHDAIAFEADREKPRIAEGDLRAFFVAARQEAGLAELAFAGQAAAHQRCKRRAHGDLQQHLVAIVLPDPLHLRAALDLAAVLSR